MRIRLVPFRSCCYIPTRCITVPGEYEVMRSGEVDFMLVDACIDQVMDDTRLTYGLEDPEARLLVEWLVEKAEHLPELDENEQDATWRLYYRRAKVLGKCVQLWCYRGRPEAAIQLAASEGLSEFLPDSTVEEGIEVMSVLMRGEIKTGGQANKRTEREGEKERRGKRE